VTRADTTHVVIVGGGFAGVGCAKELAGHDDVRVTLLDRNDYHQFQPLLYQVATSKLARGDVAYSLRALFRDDANVEVVLGDVESVDPASKTVTTADGRSFSGDVLVLAAGARARFFHTPGAEEHSFPLYTVDDATRLRGRILELFQEADANPSLIDRGALNFVVVGAGATGTEVAGALADLIQRTMTVEYSEELAKRARIVMIEHGPAVLGPFSEGAHEYAAGVLERNGVELRMETGVSEVAEDRVMLSDGTEIATRCVIWGGGIAAAPLAGQCGLPLGAGGRIDVQPDLTVEGFPDVYALGDIANIAGPDDRSLPQLGSVALQSGRWAAKNIRAAAKGKERTPFHYKDKGIMAMIGRNAAVAEVGKQRHEVHGKPAFLMWVGVHAALLTGVRTRMDAFMEWSWDYFAPTHEWEALDRSETSRIDWGDGPGGESNERGTDG
jgi:NADH:ubiquinone reductase (H+-translocating)